VAEKASGSKDVLVVDGVMRVPGIRPDFLFPGLVGVAAGVMDFCQLATAALVSSSSSSTLLSMIPGCKSLSRISLESAGRDARFVSGTGTG